jgi:hypothetical protein
MSSIDAKRLTEAGWQFSSNATMHVRCALSLASSRSSYLCSQICPLPHHNIDSMFE